MMPHGEDSTPHSAPEQITRTQERQGGFRALFSPSGGGWWLACLLIAAASIRIYSALNDLWLDEIWTLTSVRGISSPLDVFTKIHLDNNHYLNSLWFYLFRDHGDWAGYRVPSILAGVGSIMLAGMSARRLNARAAWFAMFLVAFSYVEILYSSEARGFAAVVFFSFLSFYLLDRYLEKERWPMAMAFSISSIFGFAAHLIYLNFYCAAFLWSGWRFMRSSHGIKHALKAMLACHAAPAAFFAALYIIDLRHLVVGGGSAASLPATFAQSLAWAIGVSSGRPHTLAACLVAALVFCAGIWLLWRQHSDTPIFFVGVVFVFPILFILLHQSNVIYVRHFIVGMSFFLILFGLVLAALYDRGLYGRILCILVMLGFFIANGWHTIALFKYGRGHYGDAVRYLIQNTKGPEVTVGSDHDFRVSLVLHFYVDLATGNKTITYYPGNSWPHKGPEWVIYHKESSEKPSPPKMRMTDDAGNGYDFVQAFPTAPLSGLHWFVYHNETNSVVNK